MRVDASQEKGLGAILSLGGLVSAQSRHHSSGRRSAVCFQRNLRKMCIRKNRYGLSTHLEAGLCHNTRNLVEAAAPYAPPYGWKQYIAGKRNPRSRTISGSPPESRHARCKHKCPLWANNRLVHRSKKERPPRGGPPNAELGCAGEFLNHFFQNRTHLSFVECA